MLPRFAWRPTRWESSRVGIVLLAAVARMLWLLHAEVAHEVLGADLIWYASQGANLATGRGVVQPDGAPTAFFPPGTALLLAPFYLLLGAGASIHRVLNVAWSSLSCLLVLRFAERAYGRRVAGLAALLFALCPGDVFYAGFALSEIPFQTAFMAVLVLFQALAGSRDGGRPAQWFGFGLLLGAASLVRGIALPFLPVAIATFALRRRSLPAVVGMGLAAGSGLGLVVAPWLVRNQLVMGSFLFASDGARALFIAHSPAAFGGQSRATGRVVAQAFPELDRLPNPQAEVARARAERAYALHWMFTHPVRELELIPRRLYHLYADDHAALNGYRAAFVGEAGARRESSWKRTWAALADAYFHALLAFAALGLVPALGPAARARAAILPISVLYFNAVHAVVIFGIPRFHASFLPLLAILAALGVDFAVRFSRCAVRGSRGPAFDTPRGR